MDDKPGDSAVATLTIGSRYNGPPDSANGGYVSGLLARHLEAEAATVTLRQPPPLDTPMAVERSGDSSLRLTHGDALVAEAAPTAAPEAAIAPVGVEEAVHAQQRFRGWTQHPFTSCFTCGTSRDAGDGLRLFPGPLDDDANTVACVWTPHHSLADTGGRNVTPEAVWAALDCPGAWSGDISGRPLVLGRMAAFVSRTPAVDQEYVVMGKLTGGEGRKQYTTTAVYTAAGELLASAEATWIFLKGS
ncbi:hypothetical protein [Haloactinospora alba]|nr:hypothetical protein [Haloactinospora alba]